MAESTKEATAEGAKVTTVATGEHATAAPPAEPETGFPLYAMRMRDFLELTRLEPHNTLAAKSLVVPVDFAGEHRGERLNFRGARRRVHLALELSQRVAAVIDGPPPPVITFS